jgi:hypothetical protein
MKKIVRKFLFGLSLAGFPAFCLAQGTVVYANNPVIVKGMKNQGTYVAGTSYAMNDVVVYSGASYLSLVADNVGHTPSSSPTQWQPLGSAVSLPSTSSLLKGNGSGGAVAASAGTDYPTVASVTSAASAATAAQTTANAAIPVTQKAAASGVATLDALAKIPSAQVAGVGYPITSGAMADYHFLDGTSTVKDWTGNGNDATGNGSVTWLASGLKFGDEVGANKIAGVQLPTALNTFQTVIIVAYQNPIQTALFPVNYAILLSSSQSTGFNLLTSYVNGSGNYDTAYSLGTFVNGVTNNYAVSAPSGLHAYAFVCGSGAGLVDHMYIDGYEVQYGKTQGTSCGSQTSGNLYIGNSGTAPWLTQGELNGNVYRAAFWSTKSTAAQVAADSSAMLAEVRSRGVTGASVPSVNGPMIHGIGDSIMKALGATTSHISELSLKNQPTYIVKNWGISSVSMKTISLSEENRVAPQCRTIAGGQNIAIVHAATNDYLVGAFQTGQTVWSSNISEIGILKQAGCKVFVGTMLSRNGSGANGATMDANKNAIDTLMVGQYKSAGADGIIDYAADPLLGADGANTSALFQPDHTHPNQGGQDRMAQIDSQSLNYYFSPYTVGNPKVVTASGTLNDEDAAVTIGTLSADIALVMPDCTGPSGSTRVISNPQAAHVVTIAGGTSQPINGLTTAITIAPNSTVTLTDVANLKAISGCHWTM